MDGWMDGGGEEEEEKSWLKTEKERKPAMMELVTIEENDSIAILYSRRFLFNVRDNWQQRFEAQQPPL